MELWIRSQSKETLMLVKKLSLDLSGGINKNQYIVFGCGETEFDEMLGEYKTKERTLEVLDEIKNTILGIVTEEEVRDTRIKKYTGKIYLSLKSQNIIYEMPEE